MDISFHDFVNKNKKPETRQANKVVHKETRPMNERKIIRQRPAVEKHNDYAAEADMMIENLKQKIDAVFYRFGVSGLERLDEVFCETLNEMINPSPVKKPIVKESRRLMPKKHTVKRNTEAPVFDTKTSASALEQSAQAFISAAEQQVKTDPETETVEKTGKKRFGIKEAASDAITDEDLALLGAALSKN